LNDHAFRDFDFTVRSTGTLQDINFISLISPSAKPSNEKQNLYLPILSMPLGYIFQVSCPQYLRRDFLSESSASSMHPTAFNASNFLSSASQSLVIFVNIGPFMTIPPAGIIPELRSPKSIASLPANRIC
jgi:hypothetical protein